MGIKIYKRNPDCVHYDGCLFRVAKKDAALKCSGCRMYHPRADSTGLEDSVFTNKEDDIWVFPAGHESVVEELFLRG